MTKQSNNPTKFQISKTSSLLPSASELDLLNKINPKLVDTYDNYVNKQHDHQMQIDKEALILKRMELDANSNIASNNYKLADKNAEIKLKEQANKSKEIIMNFILDVFIVMCIIFMVCFCIVAAIYSYAHGYKNLGIALASFPVVAIVSSIVSVVISKYKYSNR
ncbi:hypothetical protein [Francisella marina]|uniref:hypothetical protein n=1 Tax=Francisella marina TaxID=2249302 RepID=UPI0011F066FB|nr:hypothetical protein [Francisella marina]QEO58314.1 hypothetical protein F0R75_00455 [Francisella marina]